MTHRGWIANIADLLSGRIFNSLVHINQRIYAQEIHMTRNEQALLDAAQSLSETAELFETGIASLEARIEELEGVAHEDLSDELVTLTAAAQGLREIAHGLHSIAPSPTPEQPVVISPIEHGEIAPDPLAGLGSTNTGIASEVAQPGTAVAPAESASDDSVNDESESAPASIPASASASETEEAPSSVGAVEVDSDSTDGNADDTADVANVEEEL